MGGGGNPPPPVQLPPLSHIPQNLNEMNPSHIYLSCVENVVNKKV